MAIAEVRQVNLAQTPAMFQNGLAERRAQLARIPYGATVTTTTPKAADVVTTWRDARAWVMADPMVSNAVIDAAVGLLDEAALQALADLRTNFDQALAEYRRKLVDPTPAPAAADAMRIWARVERQLVAGVGLDAIVADADVTTLAVIQDEIRSWRRAQMPGDLQSANFIADGDLELVNQRRRELATPAQRANLDKAEQSAKGEYRVNLALGAAEHHVRHLNAAEPGRTVLPMWGEGELMV